MSKQPHKITIDPKTGHLRITYKGEGETDRLYADVTEGLSVTTGDISTEGELSSKENITAQKDSSDEATIGTHPNFSNFASFYREGDSYYTIGADSTNAFVNAQTGGKVSVREGDNDVARFSASGIAMDKRITTDLHISGTVSATGVIRSDSNISAAGNLRAGNDISAAGNIDVSGHISATSYIQSNGTGHFDGVSSQGSIHTANNISANGHIQARQNLFASGHIRARRNISASGYIQCHSDIHVRDMLSASRVRATQSASISQLFARSAHISTKMSAGNVHTDQVRNTGGGRLQLSASHAFIHFNHGSAGIHTGNSRRILAINNFVEHEEFRNTNNSPNAYMDSFGEIFRQNSSIKYKTDVQDIGTEVNTEQMYNLRPVIFTSVLASDDGERGMGLIAEEVDGYIPHLVEYDQEGLPMAVKYPMLSVVLLEEIKKLEQRVEELESYHN